MNILFHVCYFFSNNLIYESLLFRFIFCRLLWRSNIRPSSNSQPGDQVIYIQIFHLAFYKPMSIVSFPCDTDYTSIWASSPLGEVSSPGAINRILKLNTICISSRLLEANEKKSYIGCLVFKECYPPYDIHKKM